MIVLFAVMIILLIPALWAYSYRRVIAAVKVVDPVITLGPYAMGCWGLLTTWVGINIWATGTAALVGSIVTLSGAALCFFWAGFWVLMHCLGGQTPGKRPLWWREAVAAKYAWRNLERMPAYFGARTSILPVQTPRIVKPYSGSWTRPVGATLEGYLPDGKSREGFDEYGRPMPRMYPVGPEPTIFEAARWGKSVSADKLLYTFLPTAPFERLRLAGTIRGPFTFAGEVPHGAVTKWPRRSGANRAFGNYAKLGDITERRVELVLSRLCRQPVNAMSADIAGCSRSPILCPMIFFIPRPTMGSCRLPSVPSLKGTRNLGFLPRRRKIPHDFAVK